MRRLYLVVAVLLSVGAWLLLRTEVTEEKSLLSGQVTWTIQTGTKVEQGSELVRIRTLSGGEIAAARAGDRGTVQEVPVRPGDELARGTVVARIVKEK